MLLDAGRLSGGDTEAEEERVYLIARINAPIQPIDRGEQFEDPLEILLKSDGLGEVTGGGTMLCEEGSIAFCDIEIEVLSDNKATIDGVIAALEEVGAPKGSMLIIEAEVEADDRMIPFGSQEGMAIRLNAVDLPDETYETCDIDEVVEEIGQCLGETGAYRSYRSTETEYILYLYGASFEEMKERLASYIEECPLFERAVIERLGEDSPSP